MSYFIVEDSSGETTSVKVGVFTGISLLDFKYRVRWHSPV